MSEEVPSPPGEAEASGLSLFFAASKTSSIFAHKKVYSEKEAKGGMMKKNISLLFLIIFISILIMNPAPGEEKVEGTYTTEAKNPIPEPVKEPAPRAEKKPAPATGGLTEYEGKYTTLRGGFLITRERDILVHALRMMKMKYSLRVARMVKRGEIELTKQGDKVYVADVNLKSGIAKVMPEGNPAVYWTEIRALGEKYSDEPSVDHYKMKTK